MISSICVCGAGTMGSGIAQVAALSGFRTVQYDLSEEMLLKSKAAIEKNLQWLVEKQKLSDWQKQETLGRIVFTTNIMQCKADLAIEAIVEKPEAKLALFRQLDAVNDSRCIFASNTSSLSISKLQENLPYPQRVAGLHFFNPAHVMKLVEVVAGSQTQKATVEALMQLSVQMGKTPVLCTDSPGFIVNRVARPYYLEAMKLLEEGAATVETIDAVMEATGFKMGPFKLMDLIGMDVNYSVSQLVWEALQCPDRLKPSDIQKQKVEAGALGRKAGRGFYKYE